MSSQLRFTTRLFYSYSHKDSQHQEKMEKVLTLLRQQDGILKDWSDRRILPGQPISITIKEKMKDTDIFVFLLSFDFIASAECQDEWTKACLIAKKNPSVVLVPIILSQCSWKGMDGMSQLKALPEDGKPIRNFQDKNAAWQQIYDGLKKLIEKLRKTFTIRDEFRKEMEKTNFLSQKHIGLQSIFVFPRLSSSYTTTGGEENAQKTIEDSQQLLRSKYTLIHGEELSGKTALCQHLFLSLVDDTKPVIYVDLDTVKRNATSNVFCDVYKHQFYGDYLLWEKQCSKVIILDNLSDQTIDHVILAIKHFDQVIVTLSTDTFYAYYRDDDRLAEFKAIEILPLTHSKQEQLIRKRTRLSGQGEPALDGQIDQIENRINTIIISNKILPRYPFYVLSILQTYEGFMPSDLSVTSYGHCYYALILSHLLKSGISYTDDEINACLNFSEYLSFKIYNSSSSDHCIGHDSLCKFVKEYKANYLIKDATLNRLFNQDYGIVTPTGQFKISYMYYFFLGRYLARNGKKHKQIMESMLNRSYITSNCLTLIFTIHHTSDDDILNDIMLHTMCALDDIKPSVLDRKEAEMFEDIVASIPPTILSSDTIQAEREKERNERDNLEHEDRSELGDKDDDESVYAVNDIYRIMKNSEILGQILRNKYGNLEREKVIEIIETIADGGLRLVRLIIGDGKEMNDIAIFIHKKNPEYSLEKIKQAIRIVSFIWTMHNIERTVGALNKPEIQSLVKEVVTKKNTPAYDLIGYFLRLDTIEQFSDYEKRQLKKMLNKYRYEFIRKVISIRTQRYLNTHQVRTQVEQAVCSLLNIKYKPKLKRLG